MVRILARVLDIVEVLNPSFRMAAEEEIGQTLIYF